MYHIYTSLPSQFILNPQQTLRTLSEPPANPQRTLSEPSTISTEKFAHDSNVFVKNAEMSKKCIATSFEQ